MSSEKLVTENSPNFLNQTKALVENYKQEEHELQKIARSHETIEIEQPKENVPVIIERNSSENEVTKVTVSCCRIKTNICEFFDSNDESKGTLVINFKFNDDLPKLEIEDFQKIGAKCNNKSVVATLESESQENFLTMWKCKDLQHFYVLKNTIEELLSEDKVKLKEFVTEFLTESLNNQYTGLLSKFDHQKGTKSVDLDFLADSRDFNLLLLATERGNSEMVRILMEINQNTKSLDNSIDARDLALEHNHQDILLIFLKANMTFPSSFDPPNCTGKLKEFCDITAELHHLIIDNNVEKVKEILDQHKNMKHFYNFQNESAVRVALLSGSIDTYEFLFSRKYYYGPHEDPKLFLNKLEHSSKRLARDIHTTYAQHICDKHINILMANTHIFEGQTQRKDKREIIQKVFEELNSNPFMQIILKIVAASMYFKIIFDFNREFVDIVDPTVDEHTQGMFYLSGKIYVGAKLLVNEATEDEAMATLIHELCHFAMFLVFGNNARPYRSKDKQLKQEFEEISQECEANNEQETFIRLVYDCYPSNMQHAELIVRVVHLLALYRKLPEKLNQVRTLFSSLFEFYETKVVPELEKALPEIEARNKIESQKKDKKISKLKRFIWLSSIFSVLCIVGGIYTTSLLLWTCQYDQLSGSQKLLIENGTLLYKSQKTQFRDLFPLNSTAYDELKSKHCLTLIGNKSLDFKDLSYLYDHVSVNSSNIRSILSNAGVLYKNVKIQFHDLFPENSTIYSSLTSDTVTQMLKGNVLDFSSRLLVYLDEQVRHNWNNLTQKLKDKFLTSNLVFQNETIKFEDIHELIPNSIKYLTSDQITNVLSGQSFKVHNMIQNETIFYVERKFRDENLVEIYFDFMTYVHGRSNDFCIFYNKTETTKSFEEFYKDFKSQNFSTQNRQINSIKQTRSYKNCYEYQTFEIRSNLLTDDVANSLESHKLYQGLNFEEIWEEVKKFKIFILSAEAGAGKTVTLEQLTLKFKKQFPTRWVSYIDLKDHDRFYNKNGHVEDIKSLLDGVLGLNSTNNFELQTFWELFESGNVILLWNGFDEISPQFSDFILNVLSLIRNNSSIIQFVSTRPLYSNQLKLRFNITTYSLAQFNDQSQEEFLKKFFNSKNISSTKIPDYINKVHKIIESTESKETFNTPLLLGMFADMISNDIEIYESENLFDIYRELILKKLEIWQNKSEFARKFLGFTVSKYRKFDMMELYQKYALESELGFNSDYVNILPKLKIMNQTFPSELTSDEISRMGILFINGPDNVKFAHKTFAEFFVAQYFIDNIYFENDFISHKEAELRIDMFLRIFSWSFYGTVKKVLNFLKYFVETKDAEKHANLNEKIKAIIRQKYKRFLFDWLNVIHDLTSLNVFLKFFKSDHSLLNELLHVEENITVFTASYNFYFYGKNHRKFDHLRLKNITKQLLTNVEFEKFIHGRNQKGVILFSLYYFHRYKKWNTTHDEYALDDKLLESEDEFHVFESIAKNLTKDELDELIMTKTSPIYAYKYTNLLYQEKFWDFVERNLTNQDRKRFLMEVVDNYAIKNDYLFNNETFLNRILRLHEFMSDSEIFDFFSSKRIFVDQDFNSDLFSTLWPYFLNHTNVEQQKSVLVARDEYLSLTVIQIKLINGEDNFKFYSNIYDQFFTKSEIQELFSTPNDFFFLLIKNHYASNCDDVLNYIKDLFSEDKKLLIKLLEQKVRNNLNVFDYFYDKRSDQPCYEPFHELFLSLS